MITRLSKLTDLVYGLSLCLGLAGGAHILSAYVPIGGVAIAIVLGILVGNTFRPGKRFEPGIGCSEKHLLALAIALLGVDLNYTLLQQLGGRTILLITAALAITILTAVWLGKVLKVNPSLALLLGVGNGVCGSSAIGAVSGILETPREEVGLAVAVVNFLGTIGIVLLPTLGVVILGLTEIKTGILIGNTLQAVGQVVAAGFSVSEVAGQTATIVKMTRILLLTPLLLILLVTASRNGAKSGSIVSKCAPGIPWFVVGFSLCSLLSTMDLLPSGLLWTIRKVSHFSLMTAMASIGLNITFSHIIHQGRAALRLGSLLFLWQILLSGGVIYFLFQ